MKGQLPGSRRRRRAGVVMEVRFDLLAPHPFTLDVCDPAQPRPSGVHSDTNIGIAEQPSDGVAPKILLDPIPLVAGVVDKKSRR